MTPSDNVLMVFVACQTIESRTGIPIPEIWNVLREYERTPYAQRLIGRGIEKLRPADVAAARLAIYAIIDRATEQTAVKAEAHHLRAEINGSLTADRLAFDDSPEAERLRRFDLACGRGLARSLDSLFKLRRAPELVNCPSSELPGPLTAAGDTLDSSATPDETNESTDACENMTNEATDAYQRERKILKRSRIKIKSRIRIRIRNKHQRPTADCENVTNEPTDYGNILTSEPTVACGFGMSEPTISADVGLESSTYKEATWPNPTNEPTGAREIVANEANDAREFVTIEPTDVCDNVTSEPADASENVTNEPNVVRENVTNEPNDACEIVTNEPTLAAAVTLESLSYMKAPEQTLTNEPTDAGENATNEPTATERNLTIGHLGQSGTFREGEPACEPGSRGLGLNPAQAELRAPETESNAPARGIAAGMNDQD